MWGDNNQDRNDACEFANGSSDIVYRNTSPIGNRCISSSSVHLANKMYTHGGPLLHPEWAYIRTHYSVSG
jgi:hypothetical protein